MNQPVSLTKRILQILIPLVLIGLTWFIFVSRSFIQVKFTTGTTKAQITQAQTNQVVAQLTSSSLLHLPVGNYLITYYENDTITSIQAQRIGLFSFKSVVPDSQATPQKSAVILNRKAKLVTPLGQGYIYVDNTNQGIYYADANGTTDVSDKLGLTTNPDASLVISSVPVSNTIINIEPTKDGGVVVTTTLSVYIIREPANITTMPNFVGDGRDYTASAYNKQTNQLYLISAYAPSIYRYDLSKPDEAPKSIYKGEREINRIASSGDKIVAWFDAVPSNEPAVLEQYSIKRQLSPLVIDAQTSKLAYTLDDYTASTSISVSDNGKYLAIMRKLSPTIDLYDTTTKKATSSIPGPDMGAVAWQDDTLYVARGGSVWSYHAGSNFTKHATAPAPVNRLVVTNKASIITTNTGATALLIPQNQTAPATLPSFTPTSKSLYGYFLPTEH